MVMDSHPWYFVSSPRLLLLNSLLCFLGASVSAKKIMDILAWNFLCVSMLIRPTPNICDALGKSTSGGPHTIHLSI